MGVVIDPERAKRIKLVGFDIDGVLTDGGIILGGSVDSPIEMKRYHVHDGLGIYLLRQTGMPVALITGRVSDSVTLRAKDMQVDYLVQDTKAHKVVAMQKICAERGITLAEVAFVGDDVPDVALLRRVGLAVVPANATAVAREVAHVQLERAGGDGAAREFIEAFLTARGEWAPVLDAYIRARDAI